MKRNALPLMLAGLVVCGCASRMNVDVLQARIREQSVQLTESQREIVKTRAELKQAKSEVDRLRTELGQAGPEGGDIPAATDEIKKVHIYSLLSGGINKNDQPGDDAVVVQFAPFDGDNTPVNAPGAIELSLVDPQLPLGQQELGSWEFSEEECRKQWTRGLASSGFQFTLPLDEPAEHADLVVQLKYIAADERVFEASRRVKVVAPANSIARNSRQPNARNSRQPKKHRQVEEDLDDDLPPVGDSKAQDDDAEFLESDLGEESSTPKKTVNKVSHSSNWTDATIPQYR